MPTTRNDAIWMLETIVATGGCAHRLWVAFDAGRIVSPATVALMTSPYSHDTGTTSDYRYGLGFWLLPVDGTAEMEGCDAGATFRSTHRAADCLTVSVLSNTSEGAWPVAERLAELFEI